MRRPNDATFLGTVPHSCFMPPVSLLDAHSLLEQFLGGTPESAPANYHDASPLPLVGPDSPPTLTEHGIRDEIVWIENSRKLRDALANQHRPVYVLELPWANTPFRQLGASSIFMT